MRRYTVVIEQGPNNLSAYVPDLPGCVATGQTVEEIESNIREAIELHDEGMAEDGQPIPQPSTLAREVEVAPWPPGLGVVAWRTSPIADSASEFSSAAGSTSASLPPTHRR